jgi:hypothetical protein
MARNIYQQALDAQSASNLSGLAHRLAEYTTEIWQEARAAKAGMDYVNQHPVVRLMLWQMWFLAFGEHPHRELLDGTNWDEAYSLAYAECVANAIQ